MSVHSPRLSKAGMPSRSEAGAVCSKSRSLLSDIRETHQLIRSASRKSIRSLRVFEQTAPPSLREGTPPDSGGDWSTVTAKPGLHRIHYIQTFTSAHSPLTRMVIDRACNRAETVFLQLLIL